MMANSAKRPAGRPPSWTQHQVDELRRLWKQGVVSASIAVQLGKSVDAVTTKRRDLGLPEREKVVFRVKLFSTHCIVYIFPPSAGVRKLLGRLETLKNWVDEGRDDYELARSFHVPIRDVAFVIRELRLARPLEQIVPEDNFRVSRRCLTCREPFIATRYRFRCDTCVGRDSRIDCSQYGLGKVG